MSKRLDKEKTRRMTANDLPEYVWHHSCHQILGNERLMYWRLGFMPTYDYPEVLPRLNSLLERFKIKSYALYEMTGQHDLLVRLWLPPGPTADDINEALAADLSKVHIRHIDHFSVDNIVSHWVWNHDGVKMRSPSEGSYNRLSDSEIERINKREISQEEFQTYSSKDLIAPVRANRGIKFVVLVTPGDDVSAFARGHLKTALFDILKSAKFISEVSFYCGTGFAEFLMFAKVRFNDYDKINTELLKPINALGIGNVFGVRTYTHFILSTPTFNKCFHDCLPLKEAVLKANEERPLEEYLQRPEEETLEFKGSAFTDLKTWLHTGTQTVFSERILIEGVLRAIVGQLNGKGGKVIVGVLEGNRFTDPLARERLGNVPEIQRLCSLWYRPGLCR